MFVPFVPIPLLPPHQPFLLSPFAASPKDGKNFNDSSEDSADLIGKCDCHSKDLGLFCRRKGEREGIEGQEEERKKNLGFVQTKEMNWFLHLLAARAAHREEARHTARAGGVRFFVHGEAVLQHIYRPPAHYSELSPVDSFTVR